jgi:ribosomal-protein-alanine N-acetyltransferase
MTLVTARLVLEPFADAHVDALLELFRDPHVRRYLLDDRLVDRAWVEAEVQASRERFAVRSIGLFAAQLGQELLGFVGFRPFYQPPVLQLVYGVAPSHLGRGLAVEMARRIIELAFAEHGFTEVRASTDEPNQASIRVLERLGMELVATEPGEPWPQLHFAVARR